MAGALRPVFLDPTKIRMRVGALASIGHRVSAIVLALAMPFGAYC